MKHSLIKKSVTCHIHISNVYWPKEKVYSKPWIRRGSANQTPTSKSLSFAPWTNKSRSKSNPETKAKRGSVTWQLKDGTVAVGGAGVNKRPGRPSAAHQSTSTSPLPLAFHLLYGDENGDRRVIGSGATKLTARRRDGEAGKHLHLYPHPFHVAPFICVSRVRVHLSQFWAWLGSM
jgi:hypothetical protein